MEDGLVLCSYFLDYKCYQVLILVVMEDGLVQAPILVGVGFTKGLNPCCNGRWSRTRY